MTEQKESKPTVAVKASLTLSQLVHSEKYMNRMRDLLGNRAQQFVTSILSLANSYTDLQQCDPNKVITECLKAAALDLPVDPNLGFAYVLPYRNWKNNVVIPQFQMGYKGFIQLAMRSGEYETIGVKEVHDNELSGVDEYTGEEIIKFLPESERSEKIIGYAAYFITLKGFRKRLYMSNKDLDKHGAKYSKSYNSKNGIWKTEPDAMKKKTVLKLLLSRWGILSTQLAKAIEIDQTSEEQYVDRKPVIDIENAEMGQSEEDRNLIVNN